MPVGRVNRAAVPRPSAKLPEPAVPARVVTAPVAITTRRKVWLRVSATSRVVPGVEPVLSIARPSGPLKVAVAPVPSAAPAVAAPARVETSPVASTTLRMRLLLLSAT